MTPSQAATYALALCDRIATYTDVPGQITRLFLSPATADVHAFLRAEMERLGMTVRTDSIGNLRGTLRGLGPGTLLLGSHIDTVPNAGRYDGILGVAIPLALLELLSAQGVRLPYDIELAHFSEEEGIRFRSPFLGSRALAGQLTPDQMQLFDPFGVTLEQAIRDFGLEPAGLSSPMTPGTFAFLEVHIEQGPILESLHLPLGIVETIVGQTRLELIFTGQANHAGTTPMHLRRDALAAAAAWITSVETLARQTPGLVATVGFIQAAPGAPNIIPGRVTVSLDIRHADNCTRLRSRRTLTAAARSIAGERGLEVRIRQTSQQDSVPMDASLTAKLATAARHAGYEPHRMNSGAGHDAMILAPHLPTAMLFLRTPGGLSHHPEEAVSHADVQAAVETLSQLLLSFAGAPSS